MRWRPRPGHRRLARAPRNDGGGTGTPSLATRRCFPLKGSFDKRTSILLHYCLTARRDSALWRDMASLELPPTLAFKIEAWRRLGVLHLQQDEGFDETSWLAIHAGMGHWPERTDPVLEELSRDEALKALHWRRAAIARAVARLPSHADFLERMTQSAKR